MSTRETQSAARRHLQTVGRREVACMRWLNAFHPGILPALRTATAAATARDSQDTREHAMIIVAAVFHGTPGEGAARTLHAVNRAARIARKAVADAEAWRAETAAGVAADMLEYVDGPDGLPVLAMGHSKAPDRIARTTVEYVVDVAVRQAGSATLARAVEESRTHAAGCGKCDSPKAGRRPTLTGITAHVHGWRAEDSLYWTSRRAAESGLKSVDRERVLRGLGGDPLQARIVAPSVVQNVAPVTAVHPVAPFGGRAARMLPAVTVERVTVTRTPSAAWDRAGRRWQSAYAALSTVARLPRRGAATVAGAVAHAAPSLFTAPGDYLTHDAAVRQAWVTAQRYAARMDAARPDVTTVARTVTVAARETAATAPLTAVDMIRGAEGTRPLTEAETAATAAPRTFGEDSTAGRNGATDPAPILSGRRDDRGATGSTAGPSYAGAVETRDMRRDAGAIRPRPRKGARSGQTGPTVPARLTRG